MKWEIEMKEFESSYNEVTKGLKAFESGKETGLQECFNAMPMGDEGVLPHEEISSISVGSSYLGSWRVSWPWPKVVFGSYYTLGFSKTDDLISLFEMYYDGANWSVDQMTDIGNSDEINQVDVIDFGQFYGVSCFGYDSDNVPIVNSLIRMPGIEKPSYQFELARNYADAGEDYLTPKFPKFICGCNFNGQAVIGGIQSDHPMWNERGLHSVCWSGIGTFDFNIERDRTAGFADMDWGLNGQGIVYKVMKVGNAVGVFGSGGISILVPVSEPMSTFGKKNISFLGISSGNHIAGDDSIVIFVDHYKDLWMMDSKFSLKKLGYRKWMQTLNDSFVISYVPEKKRFFISDNNTCYVLTESGLYSCHQVTPAVGVYGGELWGFVRDLGDYEWRVETDEIDFKQRAFKTLQFLEIHGASEQTQALVKYRNNVSDEEFKELTWKKLNNQGIIYYPVSASDFKISLKGDDYRDSDYLLTSLKMRVKQTDKRNIRGLYDAN
jgi:hypothetical protein